MENKGIWDIISKLSENLGKNKDEEKTPTNAQSEETESQNLKNGVNDTNSYLKSYNPFQSAYLEKNQMTAKRLKKPNKTSIDLSSSKNLAGNASENKGNNMVKLIQRHNCYLKKIKDKEH